MRFETNTIELGGSSMYARIPPAVVKYMDISPGQKCIIEVQDEKTIIIKFE